jgi:hypothetical protein
MTYAESRFVFAKKNRPNDLSVKWRLLKYLFGQTAFGEMAPTDFSVKNRSVENVGDMIF